MCLSDTQNELSYCTILVKMNLKYKRIMLYLQSNHTKRKANGQGEDNQIGRAHV